MRIAVAGGGTLATRLAEAVLLSGHELVCVVQDGRRLRGMMQIFGPLVAGLFFAKREVAGLAFRRRIPLVFIDKMTEEELLPLRLLAPDLLLVGGFSIILKRPLLDLPRIGCVNCHSSLLPKHRGPNPFTAVILANEKETGITFHIMTEGIDTGDILRQYAIPLTDTDNAGTLLRRTSELAAEKVPELLQYIETHGLRGESQDAALACYDKKLSGEQLYLDWNDSAEGLARKIRACFPFTLARFRHRGMTVFVLRAAYETTPADAEPGTIVASLPKIKVATGDGLLILDSGYTLRPIPWLWPRFLRRPRIGERLQ